jgi:hypothetical protein
LPEPVAGDAPTDDPRVALALVGRDSQIKHHVTASLVIDALTTDRPVVVLERGGEFEHLASSVGGGHVTLQPQDRLPIVQSWGDTPLLVYEFDQAFDVLALPTLPSRGSVVNDGLVIISGLSFVATCFPDLVRALNGWADAGVSYCITADRDEELELLGHFRGKPQVVRLSPGLPT